MGSLPHVVEDCMGVLQVFSDGSIHRAAKIEFKFPIANDSSVDFKDCLYHQELGLHLRLYRPTSAADLPVVYYLHGGGFCVGSRDWPNFHNCCLRLASTLHALVIAPEYRLAPEHRLPAAMDDAFEAVKWLQGQALAAGGGGGGDEWLSGGAVDFDRVFVMGDSSGGNIAHHLAVQLGVGSAETAPVRVRGYVLLAPFFGGVERTKSEEGPSETILNLEILDRFWRLALPVEENRDHPYANPFGATSPKLDSVDLGPMLVIVGETELLKDRVEDYSKRLKEMGKNIQHVEFKGQQHGFFTNDPYSKLSDQLLQNIEDFLSQIQLDSSSLISLA